MPKEKTYYIYADAETHTQLSVWAACKKVSIKLVLKQLVDAEKTRAKLAEKPEQEFAAL